MKEIKNIIFDLGGVLINLDYQLTESAFVNLGIANFNELYSQAQQTSVFDDFEKGKISDREFFDVIRSISKRNMTDHEIKNAWNAMLLDFPLHRLQLLESVKHMYNVYLLSNTNNVHINAFTALLEANYGYNKFAGLFRKIYYSSQIGCRKPDKAIFDLVMADNNLLPHETIFIDDSIQHIKGAVSAGIEAHLLEKQKDVSVLLKELELI